MQFMRYLTKFELNLDKLIAKAGQIILTGGSKKV
jgi:hypothetical protein